MAALRRARLHRLSVAVLLVVTAVGVVGLLTLRSVVNDEHQRLLRQRTEEAGLVLSQALSSIPASLTSVVAAAGGDPAAAVQAARPLVGGTSGYAGIAGLVPAARGGWTPRWSVGAPVPSDPDVAAVANRVAAAAAAAPNGSAFGTAMLQGPDGHRVLVEVDAAPSLAGGVVATVTPITASGSVPTSGKPFSELDAAIYVGTTAGPDRLVGWSGRPPPYKGITTTVPIPIGAGTPWLLVARARTSLVGGLAETVPWVVFSAFLLLAVLLAGVVEVLLRRRAWAMELVDTRTAELTASLHELAVAQDQLVRSERLAAIGELASTVGHELRNPLGVLTNVHYLVRADLARLNGGLLDDDALRRHLATSERETAAATVIVSDLLEFARQRDPVPGPVDLAALVREAAEVVPPPAGVQVRLLLPREPVTIAGDRDQLRQVIVNLLSNAQQAVSESERRTGRVDVAVDLVGSTVSLRVTDDGPGMPPQVRGRVYEPFFTTRARGVGLGLAVSRRIVEAHGGQMELETAPGRGTTFRVTLPVPRGDIPLPRMDMHGAGARP